VVRDDDGGIFGPDMACGADVLDLLASQPTVGSHVTGLSESNAGLDINGQRFTARGVVHALDSFARLRATRLESASVQGFGMVGAPVAHALDDRGISVRAVSNRHGALVSDTALDIRRLFELWLESGDDCITDYANSGDSHATFIANPEALLDVSADIFVPVARTTMLALSDELDECRGENRDVRSVEEFLERSGCALVLEAANHPLTLGAEEYLERRGVVILPDVLVNSGGMVGCYAEWRYRPLVRSGAISLRELADRCHAYTARVVEENVRTLVTTDASARCAASSIVLRNRAALLSEATTRDDLFCIDH
jgi:glutamate dehydrogenase/leucine dehydrogenase